MEGFIDVYIKDNHIEVMGQEFLLGELTVSLLNIDNNVLRQMGKELVNLERLAEICREKHIFYRKKLNVDEQRKFEIAQNEIIKFPTYEEWVEIHKSVCLINEMFRTTKVGKLLWVPLNPNFTDILKDVPYDSLKYQMGWIQYLEQLDLTMGFVEDIFAFVRTIRNFTICIIPGLKKYDASHLAGAYGILMYDERCKCMVASENDPDKMTYTNEDFMILQYIPMPKKNGKGFVIAEYFRMDNFQALMKTDLLRGMMKGHFPRRCEHCGRYFLMTKGYRTKFCDMPSPEDPNRTCNQISYAKKRIKEENANNPKYQSYKRCVNRIYKAAERGTITDEQKSALLSKAEALYTTAMMSPEYSNEEFNTMLQSKNLYKLCGIDTPHKGRPKKGEDND